MQFLLFCFLYDKKMAFMETKKIKSHGVRQQKKFWQQTLFFNQAWFEKDLNLILSEVRYFMKEMQANKTSVKILRLHFIFLNMPFLKVLLNTIL